MRRPMITCCAAMLATLPAVLPRPAAAQPSITAENLTDTHVRKAIDAIVEELYERKQPGVFWDPVAPPAGSSPQRGGYTALTVLALLYAGETYQDPRLRDAVEHLSRFEMDGTYAVSLRAGVWAKLPPKFNDQLAADTQWLLDGFSERAGGWTYEQKPNTARRDNSIRQYGALGLWEAAKRGIPIDSSYWQKIEEMLLRYQLDDGGWNYRCDETEATGSMTAAGLATLFITQDFLHAPAAVRLGANAGTENRRAIENGLEWMRDNFRVDDNPGSGRSYFYYMYGVERVGLASGVKYFGEHDWYRQGAAHIINEICRWDGRFQTMNVVPRRVGSPGAFPRVEHLAFSLMFLSRGRVPVAVNKLEIPGFDWNNRPRDAANFTDWLTDATEAELSWQIVSMEAEAEQWLDAPLLYLASDKALPWLGDVDVNAAELKREARQFLRRRASGEIPMDAKPPSIPTAPELRKLKRYLDLGGMLLAVNEGSGRAFADSVQKLGTLMYPQYDWRPLRDDHWAYNIHDHVRARRPRLMALSNGVRELIILSPAGDLAGTFQARDRSRVAQFETTANLYFYASEMNRPRPRLDRHFHAPDDFVRARRTISVVRAVHEGNWKPEPRALEVFRSRFAQSDDVELRLVDAPLHAIDQITPAPALVIVCGTEAHEFSRDQRMAVRSYVNRGGMILFETPGGLGEFTLSAEQMAFSVFNRPIRSLLRDPPVTGGGIDDAENVVRLHYRPFCFEIFGSRETTARLRGMRIDNETRVLFSREDITHGLLDQPCWGISGYAPESARRLMANIVRYAMMIADSH